MTKASAIPAIIRGAYGFDREVVIIIGAASAEERASALRKASLQIMCTSISRTGPLSSLPMRRWSQSMAHPGDAKAGGKITNIASAALIGSLTYGHTIYAASKAALLGLMRAAAFELADHKITVNTIMAGGGATPGAIQSKGLSLGDEHSMVPSLQLIQHALQRL